jgi:hypothetical protein
MSERRLTCAFAVATAIALSLAAFVGAAAGGTNPANLITQTSIGGATLGGTARDYTHTFGSPDFRTRLPGALVRLTFSGGELQVFLHGGRGVAILTSSDKLRTAEGVGPCVNTSRLRRVYGRRLVGHKPAHRPTAVAFNLRNLVFATPSRTVAAVLLTRTPSKYLTLLLNSSACGGGEEE